MKISIITTIYKAEKDLPRLLDSMMAQKSKELEFFLIDNGSPDQCGEICRKYVKKDSRFTVYTLKENIGYIKARNLGMQVCTGDYIGFCDSDDFLEPGGYDKAVGKLKETNCDLYLTAYHTVNENRTTVCKVPYDNGIYKDEEITNCILPQAFGSIGGREALHGFAWKQIFRRKILVDNEIAFMPELQPYEDQILNIDMIHASNSVCVDDTVIYNYVVNSESITAKLALNFEPEEEWKRLKLFYQEKGKRVSEPRHSEALANQMVSFLLSMVLNTARMRISTATAAKKLSEVIEKPMVKKIYTEMSLNLSILDRTVIWMLSSGWYALMLYPIKLRDKVRRIK